MKKVLEQIGNLKERCAENLSSTRKSKVELYCEGLKSKLEQVEYSLYCIRDLAKRSDETESTTDVDAPSVTMQVNFYCDTFWTFLYSSLDVLSQILNQVMRLELDERNVSFKNLPTRLSSLRGNNNVLIPYNKCLNSRPFANLDKYRNCSLHRRHIYIEEKTQMVKVKKAAGYFVESTGDTVYTVTRLICDDPYDPIPKLSQGRLIPDYMESTKEKIYGHIIDILKESVPVQ